MYPCQRCRRPTDPRYLNAQGVCAQCLQEIQAPKCQRCGSPRHPQRLLCGSCETGLARALAAYQDAMRLEMTSGFTPASEARLRSAQQTMRLLDADVAHLEPHVQQARLSQPYQQALSAARAEAERLAMLEQQRLALAAAEARAQEEFRRQQEQEALRKADVQRQQAEEARRLVLERDAQRLAEQRAEEERARARQVEVSRVQEGLRQFARVFHEAVQDGVITAQEWNALQSTAVGYGLRREQAMQFVRNDAMSLLERTITFAADDGVITQEEHDYIIQLCDALAIGQPDRGVIHARVRKLRQMLDIRNGSLPIIPEPGLYLESDESCHLRCEAHLDRSTTKKMGLVPGRLVATSRKLYFASQKGGFEIPWKSVLNIERHRSSVILELSQKSGAGAYHVDDPETTEAILDTIVRMQKRRLLGTNPEGPSRRIPQDVRIAVWQRDGGKCVECGANTYLEYDHIIPFSQGGASTIANIQLLCRTCNLKKGARI